MLCVQKYECIFFVSVHYSCDFESECIFWNNMKGKLKWRKRSRGTPTILTGPRYDHTYKSGKGLHVLNYIKFYQMKINVYRSASARCRIGRVVYDF